MVCNSFHRPRSSSVDGGGPAGLNIYRAALEDPSISSVTLLMRREMPQWAVLPTNAAEKTTTIVHKDFTSYSPDLMARLSQHDACIWALGKSAIGVSEDEYTSFTYTAPMAFTNALRDARAPLSQDCALQDSQLSEAKMELATHRFV